MPVAAGASWHNLGPIFVTIPVYIPPRRAEESDLWLSVFLLPSLVCPAIACFFSSLLAPTVPLEFCPHQYILLPYEFGLSGVVLAVLGCLLTDKTPTILGAPDHRVVRQTLDNHWTRNPNFVQSLSRVCPGSVQGLSRYKVCPYPVQQKYNVCQSLVHPSHSAVHLVSWENVRPCPIGGSRELYSISSEDMWRMVQ